MLFRIASIPSVTFSVIMLTDLHTHSRSII